MTIAPIPGAIWLLACASIALSAAAQLLMKIGMSALRLTGRLDAFSPEAVRLVLFNPWVVAGLASYALSAALWLVVLSRMPLSLAYPLISMGIVLVILLSTMLLGETIGPLRAGGVALIVVGVILIGL